MRDRHPILVSLFLVLLISACAGCGQDTISEDNARSYVDEWSTSVESSLREAAFAPAAKTELEARLGEAAAAESSGVQREEPPFDVFVKNTYERTDYRLQLVDSTGLTERGRAVWDAIGAVDDHALDSRPYRLDDIRTRLDKVQNFASKLDSMEPFEPDSPLQEAAISWVMSKPKADFALNDENHGELTEAMLDEPAGSKMNQRMDNYRALADELGQAQAELEYLLASGAVRYAREMRHFRLPDVFVHEREDDPWTDPEIEGRRPDDAKGAYRGGQVWRLAARMANDIGDENEVEILHEKLQETLDQMLTGDTPEETLASLPPQHPQYGKLVEEYRRYKGIVDNGGWDEVRQKNGLRRGSSGEVVADLKKRLQIEGYFPEDGSIDETFGDALEQAVEAYQKTHQMRVDGRAHSMFWSSVNIPAERRMKQIGLNLQRWRESNIRHSDPRYVYVNIPDFHVEVWNDQQRAMRFRIVVGNNDLKIDKETKEREHPNRTPTLSAYIDRVIYNPFWNVTDRIRAEEILPEVREQVEGAYKAKLARLVEKVQEKETKTADSTFASGGLLGSDPSGSSSTGSEGTAISDSDSEPDSSTSGEPADALPDAEQEPSTSGDKKADISKYLTRGPEGKQLAFRVGAVRSLLSQVYGASDDKDEETQPQADRKSVV